MNNNTCVVLSNVGTIYNKFRAGLRLFKPMRFGKLRDLHKYLNKAINQCGFDWCLVGLSKEKFWLKPPRMGIVINLNSFSFGIMIDNCVRAIRGDVEALKKMIILRTRIGTSRAEIRLFKSKNSGQLRVSTKKSFISQNI